MDEKIPWWKKAVIYQIYPRSFQDSEGDGVGDLQGIIARMEYLQALGIDAIWLSPINTSPMVDFGYDVADFLDIDPIFGSIEDMDQLISTAHEHGIKVIMDLVLNHTSDQHAWFLESRSSRENPYRDWYIWADPKPNGKEPNNWVSIFGGKAWKLDKASGQYYYHMFCPEQPDLNWRNQAVRSAVMDIFRFWMKRGVDGFRLDVFNEFFKDEKLRDNPRTKFGFREFERQDHIYDIDQPEMMEVVKEIREVTDEFPERYVVGETFFASPERASKYIGDHGLQAAFNFELLNCPWNAEKMGKALARWEAVLTEDAWPTLVINNHDNPRSATRYKDDASDRRSKAAAVMLLTARGTPFIYYGEEIGMRSIKVPYGKIMDPPGKRYYPFFPTRDACRSPMQWDDIPGAGFTGGQPWLPIGKDIKTRNVLAQLADQYSLLQLYMAMLEIRKQHLALQVGDFEMLDAGNKNILLYTRSADETFLVAINFAGRLQEVKSQALAGKTWMTIFSSLSLAGEWQVELPLSLQPYEAVICREIPD